MICSYFVTLCYILQYIHITGVLSRRKPLERFLLEEGAKAPIFGSYNYNPIKQVFDVVPDDNNTQLHQNGSYYSTAFPNDLAGDGSQRHFIFRKHAPETVQAQTPAAKENSVQQNATTKI